MEVNVSNSDGKVIIALRGRFDFNAHREFRAATDQAISDPAHTVHVDLGGVDYLDSSALGMLLMLRDKARGAGKEVALANPQGSVKQVIDIANFGKLFSLV
jgi:HptB-dependent secretion and biofilm anti anti-sigma factor